MPLRMPCKLGPFSVDRDGRLSPCDPRASPAFLFRWRNRLVRLRLAQADPAGGRLILQTTLARITSTAAATDEQLRPRSFALLRWLSGTVPPDWRVSLLPDHRVLLETEAPIDLPITAAALLSRITSFVLELAPFVELLDETGLTVPGTSSA